MIINIVCILIACVSIYLAFFKHQKYHAEISRFEEKKERLQDVIDKLNKQREELLSLIQEEQVELRVMQSTEIQSKLNLDKELEEYKQEIEKEKETYLFNIENAQQEIIQNLKQEQRDAEAALKKIQETLSAGVQASLREKEMKEKVNFYKLSLSDTDLEDVVRLNNFKTTLHQPVILSKLIWTQYFQKQTNELCNRVLGTQTICGIYKITNIESGECYIGQSVNVAERFKQHVKKGLGIEASATNKLYNAMQKDGVWNYTFELLEACTREELNEKEKLWINTYQSNIYGLNGNAGTSNGKY